VKRLGVEAVAGSFITVTVSGGRVSSARRITPAPGANIRPVLGQSPLGIPPVHLVVSEPDHVHRMLHLPPMTAKERAEVVQREGAREGENVQTAGWQLLRRVEIDGLPNDEVLLVLASATKLEDTLTPLASSGVTPRVVLTGPLALIGAAKALTSTPLTTPTALVHWSASTLTIVVVSEGILKFARVIEAPAAALDPFEWIPVEIERSIRHYGFLAKGERVEQVMVSVAEGESARRLFGGGDLAERLRVSVTNLNALLAPSLPHVAELDLAAGAFILAYGAATLGPADAPNLLPRAMAFAQRSRFVMMGAVAATVLAAVVIAWSTVSLLQQERELRARVTQVEAAGNAGRARLRAAEEFVAERQRHAELARLLTDDPLRTVPPPDALRELARLVPADLRLDQVTMGTDGTGYSFTLTGRVELEDLTEAQRVLTDFYYGLRASPLFAGVQIRQTSRVTASGSEPAPAPPLVEGIPATALPAPIPTPNPAPNTAPETPTPTAGAGQEPPAPAAGAAPEPPLGFVVVAQLRRLA
jgi:hypothetical protein